MKLGKIGTYTVVRETQLGYMLFDGEVEYFLHRNECNLRTLEENQKVDAFLYVDKKNRVAATLFEPKIRVDKVGLVEVVNVLHSTGVFVNIGISKDILVSKDELPIDISLWPQAGDCLLCTLKIKANQLYAKMLSKNDILELGEKDELLVNYKLNAYVYRVSKDGINAVTSDLNIVFIHNSNLRQTYRLGEKIEVKIMKKNDEDYLGTLIDNKEFMLEEDAKIILDYLAKHGGVMAIGDKTSSEIIFRIFKMSKAAFKRACGHLYKQQLIKIEDNKTILL